MPKITMNLPDEIFSSIVRQILLLAFFFVDYNLILTVYKANKQCSKKSNL